MLSAHVGGGGTTQPNAGGGWARSAPDARSPQQLVEAGLKESPT